MFEEIRPLQMVEYDILKELDRVCKEYKLKYFLAQGTLLGAIRHEGFIPWDDDIDIFMPLNDYNKLEKLRDICFHEPYFLQSYESEVEYRLCYKKLRKSDTTLIANSLANKNVNHGINIDIYPYISLADGKFNRYMQYLNTMIYMLMTVGEPPENHGGLYAKGSKIILSVIPDRMKELLRKYTYKRITKYEGMRTKYVYFVIGQIEVMKQKYDRTWFDETLMVKFEDGMFPVPKEYKAYLSERYGKNFMEMPPIEEQGIKLKGILAWDINTPYKEYEQMMKK